MRIRFIHETKDVTKEEISYYREQIDQLTETKVTFRSYEAVVHHKLLFTMIDGKVCNSATNTGSTMSIRPRPPRKSKPLKPETREMLLSYEVNTKENENTDYESDDEGDC
ncbi:hypothetical protein ACJJTC_000262 [Scirpophaga incertulas]